MRSGGGVLDPHGQRDSDPWEDGSRQKLKEKLVHRRRHYD
jgi:hypothetical protein